MKFTYALSFLFLVACLMMGGQAQGCICTADYSPVCGTNGVTYSNQCRLTCAGAKLAYSGPCGGGNHQ